MTTSKRKKPDQADGVVDSSVCTESRRSDRLKLPSANPTPVTKRAKKNNRERSGDLGGDHGRQITTLNASELSVKEASKGQKSRKNKRPVRYGVKRKTKQNEIKLKGVSLAGLDCANFENADGKAADTEIKARLLTDDPTALDHIGEQLDPISLRKLEIYESPRKARIKRQNSSKGCPTGVSPRKSARQQYFNPLDTSHIQAVKSALHLSTVPDEMLCRDEEQHKVFEFCREHLLRKLPGSLYICGCPGTGKSLLIEKAKFLAGQWAKEGDSQDPEVLNFNCTSLTNPSDIFQRILSHISPQRENKNSESYRMSVVKKVKNALRRPENKSTWRMVMLIIDEMDYLISKDQSVLHELFSLSAQEDSRCILIGIANAIDLVDRFLPKLNYRCCHPKVIPFPAYTKDEVITVLNQRIKVLPFTVFQPEALELCARKVAAASGDMRKALHVCRISIELLELEISNGLDGEAVKHGIRNPKAEVQIHHMAKALTKTFRSAVVDTVKLLPKHQQMVLCTAVRLFRQGKKDATLGKLNAAYVEFCKSTDIPALSVPEFSSLCSVLSDQGLLSIGSSREDRLRRVMLQVDEDDIVYALQTVRFFRNCLN